MTVVAKVKRTANERTAVERAGPVVLPEWRTECDIDGPARPERTAPPAEAGPAADLARAGERFITQLRVSSLFREYQAAFEAATGLPLALRATGAFSPPLEGATRVSEFCGRLTRSPSTCALCLNCQYANEQAAADGEATRTCFAGLVESLIPLRLADRLVGYLQTGQVRLQAVAVASWTRVRAALAPRLIPRELTRLRRAFVAAPVMEPARYDAMLRLLRAFASHLSLVAQEAVLARPGVESPLVARARAFVADHLAEALRLDQVARHVSVSTFHFCKLFKLGTGLTFTAYVARARVACAKRRLLDPHARVSEVAYEVGFQSLSQFNRVFRRLAGECPTTFRLHAQRRLRRGRGSLAVAA